MLISYTIYKHSVLATICALIGSVLVAIGVVQAVDLAFDGKFGLDLIGAIILVATGVLFRFLASLINDKVVAKKTRKALENPEICKILQSPIGAYKYSKKNPFPEVYVLIELINPSVAQVLLDAMEHNKKEKEILAKLEALESLDIASVLVGIAVYFVTTIDKSKINRNGGTCEQFNPIFT